ncbi:MAG TPA: D-amino acid dehydrogenase [Burkholderiales bacterium]|nr:D-amino acid dehydrogenase [Burkholderiales bacterium]
MRVAVLGGGVIGTTSAWYLSKAGHEVTVYERQGAVGLETSFANGGQISVSHAEPWANPNAPKKILQWLGREDAPLLFRLRADMQQWLWGMRFLLECLPHRTTENTRQLLALALYSRTQLRELRRETGIHYDELTRGILHFYTDKADFALAAKQAALMREMGVEREVKTAAECLMIEPALSHIASRIVGATYTAGDESGDAMKFTQTLACLAEDNGVRFRYDCLIKRFVVEDGKIASAIVSDEEGEDEAMTADAYVMCLGSYSPLLLRPVGMNIPVYPAKGYSITIPLEEGDEAPTVSLTDEAHKIVFSRLGMRLRVAGTAELNGYNTDLNTTRCEALVRRTFELFPRAGHPEQAEYWAGLRPATPSNLPYIGATRLPNLYLNTGHGTLGWTMACGSARAIADIVGGQRPEPAFHFQGMAYHRANHAQDDMKRGDAQPASRA